MIMKIKKASDKRLSKKLSQMINDGYLGYRKGYIVCEIRKRKAVKS